MGVSTVKWTTLDPCTSLSVRDLKQYTKLHLFKYHDIFKTYSSAKPRNLCTKKRYQRKSS